MALVRLVIINWIFQPYWMIGLLVSPIIVRGARNYREMANLD